MDGAKIVSKKTTKLHIACDIGGTFTDLVAQAGDGVPHVRKVASTPDAPGRAVEVGEGTSAVGAGPRSGEPAGPSRNRPAMPRPRTQSRVRIVIRAFMGALGERGSGDLSVAYDLWAGVFTANGPQKATIRCESPSRCGWIEGRGGA